jgi:hypothetical protein
MQTEVLILEFEDGRTDLVGPLLEAGVPANFQNQHGVSLTRTAEQTLVRSLIGQSAQRRQPQVNGRGGKPSCLQLIAVPEYDGATER